MIGLTGFSRILTGLYGDALAQDPLREAPCAIQRAIGDATALIDAMRNAMIVVDGDCSAVHMNGAACRVLDAADGLRVSGRDVRASNPSADVALRNRVARVLDESPDEPRATAILCRRPSGRWPYIIHVLPLNSSSEQSSANRALLVVTDPEYTRCPPRQLMESIFGMTHAESEIAVRVVNGDGLKPISEELHLSLSTVKTHLQHVFDKTRTHRQAELVRLLLSMTP